MIFFKNNPYSLLVAAVVLYFFVKRFWNNYSAKNSANLFSKKLENADYAREFSESLDILNQKKDIAIRSNLTSELQFLIQGSYNTIDDFNIKQCKKIDDNTYLIVIVAKYKDLSGNNRRNPSEVTHYIDLYFKVFIDHSENLIKFYSNLHESNIDKNLRTEFVNALLAKIKS